MNFNSCDPLFGLLQKINVLTDQMIYFKTQLIELQATVQKLIDKEGDQNLTIEELTVNGNSNLIGDVEIGTMPNDRKPVSGNLILNGLVLSSTGSILINPGEQTCSFSTLGGTQLTISDNTSTKELLSTLNKGNTSYATYNTSYAQSDYVYNYVQSGSGTSGNYTSYKYCPNGNYYDYITIGTTQLQFVPITISNTTFYAYVPTSFTVPTLPSTTNSYNNTQQTIYSSYQITLSESTSSSTYGNVTITSTLYGSSYSLYQASGQITITTPSTLLFPYTGLTNLYLKTPTYSGSYYIASGYYIYNNQNSSISPTSINVYLNDTLIGTLQRGYYGYLYSLTPTSSASSWTYQQLTTTAPTTTSLNSWLYTNISNSSGTTKNAILNASTTSPYYIYFPVGSGYTIYSSGSTSLNIKATSTQSIFLTPSTISDASFTITVYNGNSSSSSSISITYYNSNTYTRIQAYTLQPYANQTYYYARCSITSSGLTTSSGSTTYPFIVS